MKNVIVRADNVLVRVCSRQTSIELPNETAQKMDSKMIDKIEAVSVGEDVKDIKVNDVLLIPVGVLNGAFDLSEEIGERVTKGVHYCMVKNFDIQAVIK